MHTTAYPIGVVDGIVYDVRGWRGHTVFLDASSRCLRLLRRLCVGKPLTSNIQFDTQIAGCTALALVKSYVRYSRRNTGRCTYTLLFPPTCKTGQQGIGLVTLGDGTATAISYASMSSETV